MTDLDDLTVTHLVTVTNHDHGSVFRAECTCGWSGDGQDDAVLAELDGDDHRTVAVGPADEMDRTISGLLDLQDDLAQAVMWLAENWSADLPAPSDIGTGGPAEVLMLACCRDLDQLTRAAEVLGVELADETEHNTFGTRYRRGLRRFGRVALRVYAELDRTCGECSTVHTTWACPTCGERPGARAVEIEAA
ncbi:MAG: hypothetical protein ACRD0R_23900 [Acidimicrobiales bacterium]